MYNQITPIDIKLLLLSIGRTRSKSLVLSFRFGDFINLGSIYLIPRTNCLTIYVYHLFYACFDYQNMTTHKN